MRYVILALALVLPLLFGCAGQEADFQRGYSSGFAQAKASFEAQLEQSKAEAYELGYEAGCRDGLKSCHLCLRKPNYSEVLAFLNEDDTDQLQSVNCIVYSTRLNDNAIAKGLWCYVVVFNWSGEGRCGFHAINAFDTVDKGVVYVEPQTDQVVSLELGKDYAKNLCAPGAKFCPLHPMFVKQIGVIR